MAATDCISYLEVRNATLEMRRELRKRADGQVCVRSYVIRWDTKERRISLTGGADGIDSDVMEAVSAIASDVQFRII